MSNSFLETFVLDSNLNKHVLHKSSKRFGPFKEKSWKNISEQRPLISAISDSNSDEEITLHDVRHFKSKGGTISGVEASSSSLRNVKLKKDGYVNGVALKEKKIQADPFKAYDFLILKIEEGDTLQSISIKYHCPVADLKRANNLINNQEFYALKHLKIPVKKHGILTETLPTVHNIKANSLNSKHEYDSDIRTINIGIGSVGCDRASHESVAFFKRMDEDLVKIMLSTKSKKDSLEEASTALKMPQIQPLLKDPCNGTDCGIQWKYLITIFVIASLVIPIGIAFYKYIRSHENQPNLYSNDSNAQNFHPLSRVDIKNVNLS